MELAYVLIDRFAVMTDDHVISYVGIHECILLSREDELSGVKKSRSFKVTPDNTLTEVQASNPQVAELRVIQASHHPKAAADIGGVLTFEVHDKLAQVVVKELSRTAPIQRPHWLPLPTRRSPWSKSRALWKLGSHSLHVVPQDFSQMPG
eukprot:2645502-Amphidinium_carterae.5